jgi:hypothetical protein
MGKRSDFPRIERDSYSTPLAAVLPLLPQLPPKTRFVEPCCGGAALIGHLVGAGHICVGRYDLPEHDACVTRYFVPKGAIFISNPPWSRPVMHRIIANLSDQALAWLLIDWDWLATLQAAPYLDRLRQVVIIGRVKWIEGSEFTGKDSCCWCLFGRPEPEASIRLTGMLPKGGAAPAKVAA